MMTLSFNITCGTSDAVPKKHFTPHPLRQRSRRQSVRDNEHGIPVYKPVVEISQTLVERFPFNSRIIDDGTLVWFSVGAKKDIKLNSIRLYEKHGLQNGESWSINGFSKRKRSREKCIHTMVTFCPDLSFGVLLQHVRSRVTFKSVKSTINMSVLKFANNEEHSTRYCRDRTKPKCDFKVYKDVIVLKKQGDFKQFVMCLSPKKNYLAFVVKIDRHHSNLFLFRIHYLPARDKYQFNNIFEHTIDYEVNSIKFNERENTMLLIGMCCFYVFHPLDDDSCAHPSQTRIYGCDPYIVYDHQFQAEFLFSQNQENFYEVDIYEVKPHIEVTEDPMYNQLFDYKKYRNLQYDDLREVSGTKRVFFVHHYQRVTRLFLGFTDVVYVFNPFTCQLLCKLDLCCKHKSPFCYTLDADWSGKEVSLFCWDNLDYVSLKIYHMEDEQNISLKHQALMVVQATYSLHTLRKMGVPKFVLSLLGDSSL